MYNFSRNLSTNTLEYFETKQIKQFNERPKRMKEAMIKEAMIKEAMMKSEESKKEKIRSIIPLNIFQTWHTLELPPKMQENMELLKEQNSEFTHYLYDDEMCREFIYNFFDENILYTFDKLKPGAYKADLWRYCILYIYGGIYLDIKFHSSNGFKLIKLTDKEYYVKDRRINNINCGVYNGLLVSLPYNTILLKTINNIVENVKNAFYKFENHLIDSLMVTGPLLLSKQFYPHEIDKFALKFSDSGLSINLNNSNILEIYKEYFEEKKNYNKTKYYTILYKNADVYNYLYLNPLNKIDFSRTFTKRINKEEVEFFSSNPCIIKDPLSENYRMNIRWINYSMDEDGISTLTYPKTISFNSYVELDSSFNAIGDEIFLNETYNVNEPYKYFGLEDIRLFNYADKIYYTASTLNRENNTIAVSSNECTMGEEYNIKKNIITPTFSSTDRAEKNWCFVNYQDKLRIVYDWHPLTICDISNNNLNLVESKYIRSDFFKNVKGSSTGFKTNDELWFVLHKSQLNNYQHFFAVFDHDMNLLRYSELFKLDNRRVEFCIGLIIEDERTILSFSSLDTNIYIGVYENNYIDSIKWYNN
jgi:mannosyltransferase OCH1-like enzyme